MREELRDLEAGMKPALCPRVRKPRCFVDGGPPVVLAAGQPGPGTIAVNATDASWLNDGVSQCGVRATVMNIALAGGTPK